MGKMRMIGFLMVAALVTFQCKKRSGCADYNPPASFFFQITINGKMLPDSILSSVQLYYFSGSTKTFVTDLVQATDAYANKGILTTRDIGVLGAKPYYLSYGHGLGEDTLFVDYSTESPSTGCLFLLQQVSFNHVVISGDTTFGFQPVYVLDKAP